MIFDASLLKFPSTPVFFPSKPRIQGEKTLKKTRTTNKGRLNTNDVTIVITL